MNSTDEALHIALALAKRGYPVIPVSKAKTPTRPKREGGTGYADATADPDQVRWLWKHWPGDLVGIRTGLASNLDVVDVDCGRLPPDATPKEIAKRDSASWWWRDCHHRIPATRTFESQRGGFHLWFNHSPGMRGSTDRICKGVDVRSEGNFIIFWFCAGYPCLDHSPIADWPAWLLAAATPPPEPVIQTTAKFDGPQAIEAIVRKLENATDGRNGLIYWCAHRLRERGYNRADAENILIPAAIRSGHVKAHQQRKDRRTIASAYRGGGA
jgi:hypothetical protein